MSDALTVVFMAQRESASAWLPALRAASPRDRFVTPTEVDDSGEVDVAVVADPRPGELAIYPRLRLIQSLWRGVDSLLSDRSLPEGVPIARMVDAAMPHEMAETALLHVLSAHRQLDEYSRLQREGIWRQLPQPSPAERRVGLLGAGELGALTAKRLSENGFDVAVWSRSGRDLGAPATVFAGADGLSEILARSEILVNLLPLTWETEGILDAPRLAQLPMGAVIINLARGAHVDDGALLAALESGAIRHAVLDVFTVEPLPHDHPFWRHPRITVSPHVAARSTIAGCVPVVVANLERLRRGETSLLHVVDPQRGY